MVLPNSVQTVGDLAFYECAGLADEDGFVIVGDVLYEYMGKSSEVTVPDHVVRIGKNAFSKSLLIYKMTIPDSVRSIGPGAFFGKMVIPINGSYGLIMMQMESISIGSGLILVEEGAFQDCQRLKNVSYNGSEQSWKAITIMPNNNALRSAAISFNTSHTHVPGDPVRENETPATCISEGRYDEAVYCTLCHAAISRKTITIPASDGPHD